MGAGAVRGVGHELRDRPRAALLLGALAVALPFTLITLGELEVPSGLTAVLISPASLFVALFAPWIDPSERIDRRQASGWRWASAAWRSSSASSRCTRSASCSGALAMIGAAAFYGAVELRRQAPLRASRGDADLARLDHGGGAC